MIQQTISRLFFTLFFLGCTSQNNNPLQNNIGGIGGDVTRDEVILLADQFARIHWQMTDENTHAGGCSVRNDFTSQYPVGPRIGMGYKWSGWENIDDFLLRIKEGYGTGTGGYVNYSALGVSPDCFTGVSCTGFVSEVWQLEKKYTLNYGDAVDAPQFREISSQISYNDLKKGDALINSEHIMLYAYTNRSGEIMIFDSSVEGVSFHPVSWSYLNPRNTIPIRYNRIEEVENEQGTTTNPFVINYSGAQFVHEGNTRNVVSMIFDTYSLVPGKGQPGPECIYQLNISSSSSISINVTDIKNENIDNNVFLLTSLDTENYTTIDCIAWGDNSINIELNAGTYYVVVDSGNDLPGEYTLTVN